MASADTIDDEEDSSPLPAYCDESNALERWPMDAAAMQMPWILPANMNLASQYLYGAGALGMENGQSLWLPPPDAYFGGQIPGFEEEDQPPMQKQRFCATFPVVGRCRHGARCAYAHSREEICAPLLSPAEESRQPHAMTEEFFTQRFKTLWCPIGMQHDWQLCMYAHTYQDVRRPPIIGYGHQLCPFWSKKETTLAYAQRCPLGPRCAYAHGAKEQLYHPSYFRTLICRDLQRRRCPRQSLCAFFHKKSECRTPEPLEVEYNKPLRKDALPKEWLSYFLAPPHFQEVPDMNDPMEAGDLEPMPAGSTTLAPFWGCGGGCK